VFNINSQANAGGSADKGIAPSKANLISGAYDFAVELTMQRRKILVTNDHNDVVAVPSALKLTFIDEFFTVDFCREQGFFAYEYDKKKRTFLIDTREFAAVKQKLLQQLTNFGQPMIAVVDGNFENRAELLMEHTHEGVDLDAQYTHETLRNVQAIWTRPVHLLTKVENRKVLFTCDGKGLTEKTLS
jgi:spore cortex formation protein SpoVR/YcgB (stage V sporulation)